MITANPLFLLTKISKNMRSFIAGSAIACYGLFLYEMLPEYLFNPMPALYYFASPSAVIVTVFVVLPSLLSKKTEPQNSTALSSQVQPQVETISIEQTKEPGIIMPDNGEAMPPMMPGQSLGSIEAPNSSVIQAPVIDEMAIQGMVSRAMEPVQKDSTRMQDTIGDLRNEINSIKNSMDMLSSTVETSLTDLKSFQAELANPLNFMRKYFDSIDIKSLSDPSLPLHVEHLPLLDTSPTSSNSEKAEHEPVKSETRENSSRQENTEMQTRHAVNPQHDETHEMLSFKHMLGGGITLGKLMTTISLMEEILQTMGRDSIDVLIDQCKMMGLGAEEEQCIYNVINMMDKSGLSVNDTLIMLYKFGKVMGMNDKESDLIYAKLMVNQGKGHDNIITVEKKAG